MEVSAELYDAPERSPPHCPLSDHKVQMFIRMVQGLLYNYLFYKHEYNLLHTRNRCINYEASPSSGGTEREERSWTRTPP